MQARWVVVSMTEGGKVTILRVPGGYDESDYIIACSSPEKAAELVAEMNGDDPREDETWRHSPADWINIETINVDEVLPTRTLYMMSAKAWPQREAEGLEVHVDVQVPGVREAWAPNMVGHVMANAGTDPGVQVAYATYREDQRKGPNLPYFDLFVVGSNAAAVKKVFAERFTEMTKDWPQWWMEHAPEKERREIR